MPDLNHEVGAPVELPAAADARRLAIEAMAREAGLGFHAGMRLWTSEQSDGVDAEDLAKFAALVRAQTLEESAVICDQEAQYFTRETMDCAEAIRQRAAQTALSSSESVPNAQDK